MIVTTRVHVPHLNSIVPVRAAVVLAFSDTVTVTVALPSLLSMSSVIQLTSAVAVQGPLAFTAIVTSCSPAVIDLLAGVAVILSFFACVMVTVWVAVPQVMVILPVRVFPVYGFAVTVAFTVALPRPLAASSVIQFTSVVAVQLPLAFTVMETSCSPAVTDSMPDVTLT